jgi:hypothetical protein
MADNVDRMKGMCLDVVMEQLFQLNKILNLTSAPTKEEFFGFTCRDVSTLYFQKRDRSSAGFISVCMTAASSMRRAGLTNPI